MLARVSHWEQDGEAAIVVGPNLAGQVSIRIGNDVHIVLSVAEAAELCTKVCNLDEVAKQLAGVRKPVSHA